VTIVTPESLLNSLRWRYAVKKFDPSFVIPDEQLAALYESLRLTPSSLGLQPWKFVVVRDNELRKSLQSVSYNQSQIVDASMLLVLCRKAQYGNADIEHYTRTVATTRRQPYEALIAYRQMMEGFVASMDATSLVQWMEKQVYIALGNLLTSCALLGLDACPIEGFSRSEYDRLLELPEKGLNSLVVCAVGKRATDDSYQHAAKVRFASEDVFLTL